MIGAFRVNTISQAATAAAESYFILTNTNSPFPDDRVSFDVDAEKNIYLAGMPGAIEAYKISEAGTFTWQKSITSDVVINRNIFVDGAKILISGTDNGSPNSNYLLGVNSSDGTTNFSTRRQSATGCSTAGGATSGKSVIKDSSGNYYSVACENSTGASAFGTTSNIIICKFNSSGAFTSSLVFTLDGITSNNWAVSCMAMDSTSNLHLFCYMTATTTGYLVKINCSDMTITWKFNNGSNGFASASGMAVDTSGNIYLRRRRHIQKFNSSGTQQWQREISAAVANGDTTANGLSIDSDNNIYVAYIFSNKNFILKINSSGDVQWSRSFSTNTVSSGNQELLIRNGQMYLASRGQVSGTDVGLFIAKLPTDGTLTGTYATTLVYASESHTLSDAGPFSNSDATSSTGSRTLTSQNISPTFANTSRSAFTKTSI